MMLMTRLGAIASQYVTPPLLVDYLVIGGGGGGGANGGSGGGAGGYLEGKSLALSVDTSYTVTVGEGGARTGRMVNNRNSGVKGENSSFVGGAVNIVAIGGGYGQVGGWDQDSPGSGGSGGGGAMYSTVGTPTGASGRAGQGHKGGNATNTGNYFQSAGGGGAGSVGGNASGTTNNIGGIGGSGLSSDITGSPVVRASGGNGYNQTAVIDGGGGVGDGEPNTGGGGANGSAGGSGVVILKFPIGYTITISGLTYSSDILGEFKIYTFTEGAGTVTFSGVSYKTITVDSTKIDATLTDYPVMVKLTPSNFDFSKVRVDGMDIAFYDMSGNLLDFEREYFLANSQAVFHVRIPSVSSTVNTTFRMVYGNGLATDLSNKTGVWDNNFVMVQHMGESLEDSTGNGNNGTNYGSTVVDGLNSKARNFDGVNDYVRVSDSNSIDFGDVDFTAEAWVYNRLKEGNRGFLVKTTAFSDASLNYALDQGTGGWRFRINSGTENFVESLSHYNTNEWVHLAGVYKAGGIIKLYVNGVMSATKSGVIKPVPNNGGLYIGSYFTGKFFDGTIRDARISNIARSDAWIKADDYNLRLNTLVSIM